MPRPCSICGHEYSEQITECLLRGVPYKEIVKQYGVSAGSLTRHKQHIKAQRMNVEDTFEVCDVSEPSTVIRKITELDRRADQIYREAMGMGDILNATRALRELREITALYAKLTGELNTQSSIVHQHIHVDPEWASLRQRMLAALAPYPEARAALVEALRDAEALSGGVDDV